MLSTKNSHKLHFPYDESLNQLFLRLCKRSCEYMFECLFDPHNAYRQSVTRSNGKDRSGQTFGRAPQCLI